MADLSARRATPGEAPDLPMLTIIGCGNLNRRDDGVGVVVAQRLQALLERRPLARVRVFDAGTGGMDVMFQARGSDVLIVVDASRTGSEPGALFEVPGGELESAPRQGFSLHDFRWDHALYAGRRIYGDAFPGDVTVYLIEAADLSLGVGLTPAVAATADRLVADLERQLCARVGAAT